MKLLLLTLIGLSLAACTSDTLSSVIPSSSTSSSTPTYTSSVKSYENASPEKTEAFNATMKKVAAGIQNDPKYDRISLDTTEKKAWFKDLTFRLWDRQITKDQFMAEGLRRYPTHRYEFQFIINGFSS